MALLEHLAEKEEVRYRRLDVVAYSFGTIVAIDAFFPLQGRPSRVFQDVETLGTIRCPFDLVRTFWPGYLDNRYASMESGKAAFPIRPGSIATGRYRL